MNYSPSRVERSLWAFLAPTFTCLEADLNGFSQSSFNSTAARMLAAENSPQQQGDGAGNIKKKNI